LEYRSIIERRILLKNFLSLEIKKNKELQERFDKIKEFISKNEEVSVDDIKKLLS